MPNTKKILIGFERDWVQEKRKKFGNPVRTLEKCVASIEGASLVNSGYMELTAVIPEDCIDVYLHNVLAIIVKDFEEPKADEVIKIVGAEVNLQEIVNQLQTDSESGFDVVHETVHKTVESETTSQEKKTDEVNTESVEEPDMVAKDEEVLTRNESTEENATSSTEMAGYEEYLRGVCNSFPVKYTPNMVDFLLELGHVIPSLKKMHTISSLWNQSLLVSIYDGYGYTAFLQAIAKILRRNDLTVATDEKIAIKEIVISRYESRDEKYNDWKRAAELAAQIADGNTRRITKCILSLDISQWQNELHTAEVSHYLRKIEALASNFLIAYRVPFMEMQVVEEIKDVLCNVTSVRSVIACPASISNLLEYMKERMLSCNCKINSDCDRLLEQWIVHEKCDDIFFGYKTIDKMVNQLIYQKALINSSSMISSNVIEKEDLSALVHGDNGEDSPYDLLENLVGIQEVKRRLREIMIQMKEQKNQADLNSKVEKPCIHMVFKGAPGTGKTTVARILAKIMKEEGVLRKGLFYEIQGRNLCGRYVGETAPKTSAYCRDAYGSILFIDEAYSLNVSNTSNDFGKEAIATLVSEMENHRDDFCVILAGYSDEMDNLLSMNPGLASRLPYEITFPNYSREELAEIFIALVEERFEYEEDLKETVQKFFSMIPESVMEDEQFGNARVVRNLFERVWGKAAYRKNVDLDEKLVIKKEDFDCAVCEDEFEHLLNGTKRKAIGF